MDHFVRYINEQFLTNEQVVDIIHLDKGFSPDLKYIVKTNCNTYLLRSSHISKLDRKQIEHDMMKQMDVLGVRTNKPIAFFTLGDQACSLLTFLDGYEGKDIITSYSVWDQYQIGIEAGKELKKIHGLKHHQVFDWSERIITKYQQTMNRYRDMKLDYPDMESINQYIDSNKDLLINRPIVFQHDDYHLGNIVVNRGQYVGVIDFNRFDYGDPIQEFTRMEMFSREVSIPFVNGQLKGYFNGQVTEHFFKILSVYMAMSFAPSLVWTKQNFEHLYDEMVERMNLIFEDYKGFETVKPIWYEED